VRINSLRCLPWPADGAAWQVLAHFVSCFWAFVGSLRVDESMVWWDAYAQQLYDYDWGIMYSYTGGDRTLPSWANDSLTENSGRLVWSNATLGTKYALCMYWSITTIATVGFGDIKPVTSAERQYAIVVMLLGGAFYGYVVANMSSIVASMDTAARAEEEELDTLAAYMLERQLPKDLANRIRKYYKLFLEQKTSLDEGRILQRLTPQLRQEVALFLMADIVKVHPIFAELPPVAITTLQKILMPMQFLQGTVVCNQGDLTEDSYILLSGQMEAQMSDGTPIATIDEGSLVGELSMLGVFKERSCKLFAITGCNCYVINKEVLFEAFKDSPTVIDRMIVKATSMALAGYVFSDETDQAKVVLQQAHDEAYRRIQSSRRKLSVIASLWSSPILQPLGPLAARRKTLSSSVPDPATADEPSLPSESRCVCAN
jgi:CRP-like cAMP-binding protein